LDGDSESNELGQVWVIAHDISKCHDPRWIMLY